MEKTVENKEEKGKHKKKGKLKFFFSLFHTSSRMLPFRTPALLSIGVCAFVCVCGILC